MSETPKIDTAKLRRLLMERQRRFERVRQLTDQYHGLRDEVGRLQVSESQARQQGERPHAATEQRLAELKTALAEVNRERAEASEAAKEMGFVQELVEYARSLRYLVDEGLCIVNAPPAVDRREMPRSRKSPREIYPVERF